MPNLTSVHAQLFELECPLCLQGRAARVAGCGGTGLASSRSANVYPNLHAYARLLKSLRMRAFALAAVSPNNTAQERGVSVQLGEQMPPRLHSAAY